MKRDRLSLVVLTQAALIAGLVGAVVYLGRDELKRNDEPEPIAARQAIARVSDQGTPVVAINNALRDGSGIEVAAVKIAQANSRKPLAGVVVSAQGMLEQVNRWRMAQAEDATAQAERKRTRSEYERVSALYKDDRNVSERALQVADAAYQSAAARTTASHQIAEAERARLRSEWGIDPTRMSGQIEALQSQRQALLQVALEPGEQTAPARVRVRPAGGGSERDARLVGPAAQPEAGLIGATFLYVTEATGLRGGMRVIALPNAETHSGYIVPGVALVWHAGRAWVYVKIPEAKKDDGRKKDDGQEFARRDVTAGEWQSEGWFTTTLSANTEIVTRGAQLLLSEEQRGFIKNENDD